jgi:hypothetical protein
MKEVESSDIGVAAKDNFSLFKKTYTKYFDFLESFGIICMYILLLGLKADAVPLLVHLLDRLPWNQDTDSPPAFGSSILLLNYFDFLRASIQNSVTLDETNEVAMQAHTDKGLFTIIPAADVPALHGFAWDTCEWEVLENTQTKPTDFLAFAGDTLEQLTAGYYRSFLHFVPKLEWTTRISAPFQLRARDDVLLHFTQLQSPLIHTPEPIYRFPVTVNKFYKRASPMPEQIIKWALHRRNKGTDTEYAKKDKSLSVRT